MSTPSNNDPRLDQAAVTDESLLAAHEQLLGQHPDDRAHYRLTPLALLFVFSGLIFWAGTYLNRYSGKFDPLIAMEEAKPGGKVVDQPIDLVAVGKNAYGQVCITCHLPTGQGQPGIYPPLAGSEWVLGSEDRVIRIVLHGLKGPVKVKGNEFGNAAMPAFRRGTSYNWTDEKIAAVLTYVRQEWGNNAPKIEPAKVTEIHNQIGDRAEWSQDELLKVQ